MSSCALVACSQKCATGLPVTFVTVFGQRYTSCHSLTTLAASFFAMVTHQTMSYPFQAARFMLAAHLVSQLPANCSAKVAFTERSNAGKSNAT